MNKLRIIEYLKKMIDYSVEHFNTITGVIFFRISYEGKIYEYNINLTRRNLIYMCVPDNLYTDTQTEQIVKIQLPVQKLFVVDEETKDNINIYRMASQCEFDKWLTLDVSQRKIFDRRMNCELRRVDNKEVFLIILKEFNKYLSDKNNLENEKLIYNTGKYDYEPDYLLVEEKIRFVKFEEPLNELDFCRKIQIGDKNILSLNRLIDAVKEDLFVPIWHKKNYRKFLTTREEYQLEKYNLKKEIPDSSHIQINDNRDYYHKIDNIYKKSNYLNYNNIFEENDNIELKKPDTNNDTKMIEEFIKNDIQNNFKKENGININQEEDEEEVDKKKLHEYIKKNNSFDLSSLLSFDNHLKNNKDYLEKIEKYEEYINNKSEDNIDYEIQYSTLIDGVPLMALSKLQRLALIFMLRTEIVKFENYRERLIEINKKEDEISDGIYDGELRFCEFSKIIIKLLYEKDREQIIKLLGSITIKNDAIYFKKNSNTNIDENINIKIDQSSKYVQTEEQSNLEENKPKKGRPRKIKN